MGPQTIYLHQEAPPKPAPGAPCNGCGLCCAWQPCPVGVLISRRRHGACVALRWEAASSVYRCAVVDAPQTLWPALPQLLHPLVKRLARRWIAAGVGCDCDAEAELPGAA